MLCEASGSESLRFLLGDVVKVKALFPCGIRLLGRNVLKREDKEGLIPQRTRNINNQGMLEMYFRRGSSIKVRMEKVGAEGCLCHLNSLAKARRLCQAVSLPLYSHEVIHIFWSNTVKPLLLCLKSS